MPGMMDTVLNLGLNDVCAAGLAARAGDERFAYDAYRRFLDMYGNVVMDIPHNLFEAQMEHLKVRQLCHLLCTATDSTATGEFPRLRKRP